MVMGVIYKLSYITMCDKSQKLYMKREKFFPFWLFSLSRARMVINFNALMMLYSHD